VTAPASAHLIAGTIREELLRRREEFNMNESAVILKLGAPENQAPLLIGEPSKARNGG
jgi:hypothetical protein